MWCECALQILDETISPLCVCTPQILDEGTSPYLEENLANRTALEMGVTDAGLAEANLKHAINGFLFCNAGDMVMKQGER